MILGQEQNSTLGNGGITQDNLVALQTSTQHDEYSINGNPNFTNKPLPSQLDLNGITPLQYIQNFPS